MPDCEFGLVPVKKAVGLEIGVEAVLVLPMGTIHNGRFVLAATNDDLRLVEALLRLIGAVAAMIVVTKEHRDNPGASIIPAKPFASAAVWKLHTLCRRIREVDRHLLGDLLPRPEYGGPLFCVRHSGCPPPLSFRWTVRSECTVHSETQL